MLARLAFAVASICQEPDILLVDEALSVGDHKFQMRCLDRLRTMHERGAAVIFVSHADDLLRDFCTRAVWLDRGELHMDGEVNEVLDAYLR
jgi:teichoic acid transport system ATP-binding protein